MVLEVIQTYMVDNTLRLLGLIIPEVWLFILIAKDNGGFRFRLSKYFGETQLMPYQPYVLIAASLMFIYLFSYDLTMGLINIFVSGTMQELLSGLSLISLSLLWLSCASAGFLVILYYIIGKTQELRDYLIGTIPIIIFLIFLYTL